MPNRYQRGGGSLFNVGPDMSRVGGRRRQQPVGAQPKTSSLKPDDLGYLSNPVDAYVPEYTDEHRVGDALDSIRIFAGQMADDYKMVDLALRNKDARAQERANMQQMAMLADIGKAKLAEERQQQLIGTALELGELFQKAAPDMAGAVGLDAALQASVLLNSGNYEGALELLGSLPAMDHLRVQEGEALIKEQAPTRARLEQIPGTDLTYGQEQAMQSGLEEGAKVAARTEGDLQKAQGMIPIKAQEQEALRAGKAKTAEAEAFGRGRGHVAGEIAAMTQAPAEYRQLYQLRQGEQASASLKDDWIKKITDRMDTVRARVDRQFRTDPTLQTGWKDPAEVQADQRRWMERNLPGAAFRELENLERELTVAAKNDPSVLTPERVGYLLNTMEDFDPLKASRAAQRLRALAIDQDNQAVFWTIEELIALLNADAGIPDEGF